MEKIKQQASEGWGGGSVYRSRSKGVSDETAWKTNGQMQRVAGYQGAKCNVRQTKKRLVDAVQSTGSL